MTWNPDPAAWRQSYNESGYLVVENVLEPAELQQLSAELDRVEVDFQADTLPQHLRPFVTTDADRLRWLEGAETGGRQISNMMELPLFAPVFRDIIIHPRMLDVLEAIFESVEFGFHNLKCICKMPHNDTPFQWHRDLPYLEHTTPNLLTCMLCIDPMTEENGATVMCPGSHRIRHEDVLPTDTNIAEAEVPAERATVVCPAGSLVLFHVNIVHGGGPNRSETKRRNVIGIWAGEDSYPTTGARYAYEFVKPRSTDPMRRKQIEMTFH